MQTCTCPRSAAQNPEQSNHPDVTESLFFAHLRLDRAQLMRHKDANLHLAKKCGTGFQKAAQYQPYCLSKPLYIFKARWGTADAPQGCKPALDQEVRHWLPKSNQPDVTNYIFVFLSRNIDICKARRGTADAPQGCKPALDQDVRH